MFGFQTCATIQGNVWIIHPELNTGGCFFSLPTEYMNQTASPFFLLRGVCLQRRVSSETCLLTVLCHCCVVTGWCECLKDTHGSVSSHYQIFSAAEELELSSPWPVLGLAAELKCQMLSQLTKWGRWGDLVITSQTGAHTVSTCKREKKGLERIHRGFQLPQLSAPLCVSTSFQLRLWAPTA